MHSPRCLIIGPPRRPQASAAKVQAPRGHTAVASGVLEKHPAATDEAERDLSWVYRVPCPIPARCMVVAVGALDIHITERPTAAVRQTAEALMPVEDGGGHTVEAGGPLAADTAVTAFAATRSPSAALLESTCEALPLLQSLAEHALQCRLPWSLYSVVFAPRALCQVRPPPPPAADATSACWARATPGDSGALLTAAVLEAWGREALPAGSVLVPQHRSPAAAAAAAAQVSCVSSAAEETVVGHVRTVQPQQHHVRQQRSMAWWPALLAVPLERCKRVARAPRGL